VSKNVKLFARNAGLPGKEVPFFRCAPYPRRGAGLAGCAPGPACGGDVISKGLRLASPPLSATERSNCDLGIPSSEWGRVHQSAVLPKGV
jgi:hypothetical protein